MLKKCKTKIIATLLLILTLISNIIPIIPAVKSLAVNNIGTTLDIVCVGYVPYHLKSHAVASGGYVRTSLAGYYDNGTFYPAFCLEREKPGVGSDREYSVTLTEILSDRDTYNKIWRVVTAGYPYKSIESLGVSDWRSAYQATKMAVYCVLGQSDINAFYADDAEGQAIVNLIHRLVNEGVNGTSTYRTPVSSINKSGNMVLSGNYYIQNYSLTANVEITNYDIATTGFPTGTLITDTAGTQKTTFNPGEIFQVRIPKNSVETRDVNGRIRATVTSKSYAVFYGASPDDSLQDYAVAGDPIALTSSSANIDLKGNTAGIKIQKVDEDTNQPIPNTVFQISKQDGTVIGTATTNAAGIATFSNLYQANYVLKEIKSNDNYVIMQENINIPAYYNKITEQTLTNEHKKGNLKIYKVDKDNNKITLGNVEFDLYSEEFKKVIGTYKTSVDRRN